MGSACSSNESRPPVGTQRSTAMPAEENSPATNECLFAVLPDPDPPTNHPLLDAIASPQPEPRTRLRKERSTPPQTASINGSAASTKPATVPNTVRQPLPAGQRFVFKHSDSSSQLILRSSQTNVHQMMSSRSDDSLNHSVTSWMAEVQQVGDSPQHTTMDESLGHFPEQLTPPTPTRASTEVSPPPTERRASLGS